MIHSITRYVIAKSPVTGLFLTQLVACGIDNVGIRRKQRMTLPADAGAGLVSIIQQVAADMFSTRLMLDPVRARTFAVP